MRWLMVGGLVVALAVAMEASAETVPSRSESKPLATGDERLVAGKIDELLSLQDQAAAGSRTAVGRQKSLLAEIGRHLQALPEISSAKLAVQVSAYVLSGGNPKFAEGASKSKALSTADQRILESASLFMRGDRVAAARLLATFDPARLPARIAGRMALAQALLSEKEKMQAGFAIAVSAMPGTLVEESALRRSAIAFAESREERPFWRRLDRYARRFPYSPYAEAFWNDAMTSIVNWTAKAHGPSLVTLDRIAGTLALAQRRRLYLTLARQSAVMGVPQLAKLAGRRLQRLALEGSMEDDLGRLYMSVYEIVSPEGETAMDRLNSLRPNGFSPLDRALYWAALALAQQIERPLAHSDVQDEAATEHSAVETRGADLLSQSDMLLQR